jgi:hypothetical protein
VPSIDSTTTRKKFTVAREAVRCGKIGAPLNQRSIKMAYGSPVRGSIAVTAIMGAGITCLTRIAAEWIPAPIARAAKTDGM